MLRTLIAAALMIGLVGGCESSSSNGRNFKPKEKDTILAASAANSRYPTDLAPLDGQAVTSTINKGNGNITIRNFTDQSITEPRLWVNGVYVLRLRTIGPQSVIVVNRGDVFDSSGRSLATQPVDAINKVELETEQNLIRVQGPQFD